MTSVAAARPTFRDDLILRFSPTIALIMAYAFLAPLGNLARFSEAESAAGTTTLILVCTVALNFVPSLQATLRNRMLFSLALLTAWMFVASLLYVDPLGALIQTSTFALYVLFACVAYRIDWTERLLQQLLVWFLFGAFLSSFLTIIDFFGIVDVPRVNEGSAFYTATSLGAVLQASGPFPRRSAMAAYFALVIPAGVLASIYLPGLARSKKIFLSVAAALSFVALLMTHNRAGLLGPIGAILAVNVLLSKSPLKLIRLFILMGVAVALVGLLLDQFFHDQILVYEALLRIGDQPAAEGSFVTADSDKIRWVFFQYVVNSLRTNPVGNGFTLITGVPDHPLADAHNILSMIMWSTGVFGVAWLVYFSMSAFRRTRVSAARDPRVDPLARYAIVLVGALLGWALCGQMHQILGTGMAWLLLGVLIKLWTAAPQPSAATE